MGRMTSLPTSTELTSRPPLWRRPLNIIRENKRAYLIINLATYGLAIIGFLIGLAFPALSAAKVTGLQDNGTEAMVVWLINIPPLFALVILAVNVFQLSLLTIVLPSLVVPFAGLAFFGYWAVQTGITLAPGTPEGWVSLIPHSLTFVIELQAYVIVALGTYRLGSSWLFPRSVGAPNRRRGYLQGLKHLGLLALPALLLLIIGAVWEAYSLRYFIYPLQQLLL